MNEFIFSWGLLFSSVLFNALGVFIIKSKLNLLGEISFSSFSKIVSYFFSLIKFPIVILGLILFFLAPFLFATSLSRLQLSVAYPVQVGLNFIIVLILALLFLGESLTLNKILAIFLLLISIFLLYK